MLTSVMGRSTSITRPPADSMVFTNSSRHPSTAGSFAPADRYCARMPIVSLHGRMVRSADLIDRIGRGGGVIRVDAPDHLEQQCGILEGARNGPIWSRLDPKATSPYRLTRP